jgi:pathogenesis-related protein 1
MAHPATKSAPACFGLLLALTLGTLSCNGTSDDEPSGDSGSGGGGSTQQGGSKSQGSSGSKADAGSSSASSGSSTGGSGSMPVGSDFPDAQVYVDAHNAVRAAVEKPSNYQGTWSPLPPVAWSDEVASTAQEWANHLKDTKDCGLEHADGTGYGENLAAGTNVDAQRAVDMWAGEKKNYTYSPEYVFMGNTGHYTQIVWRESTHIGCASASCGGSNVVVCRYDPPGNFIGNEIF